MINTKRLTIGLLIGSITNWYHQNVWASLDDEARARDVNLITVTGGAWKRGHTFMRQHNAIYERGDQAEIDGLLVMATLVSPHGDSELLDAFCQRFEPIPRVTIGAQLAGTPAVLLDSYQGMFDQVTHLIEVHGYRRIVFIRGPEGNFDAQERYRAYVDALAHHGLPFDPDLVISGGFHVSAGRKTIERLIDQQRMDFDAIVAVSDGAAVGAMEAMQARGICVPDDVALVGFDDSKVARAALSPLTTVSQPIERLSQQAMALLLAQLAGEDVPEQIVVPAELVVRQSCGCLALHAQCDKPARINSTGSDSCECVLAQETDRGCDTLSQFLERGQRAALLDTVVEEAGQELEPAWIARLLDGFIRELCEPVEPGTDAAGTAFWQALNWALRQTMVTGGDVIAWHRAIAILRHHLLPHLGQDTELIARAESLWQEAHVAIGQITRQAHGHKELQDGEHDLTLFQLERSLVTVFDQEELVERLVKTLPVLGIPGCYIATYEASPDLAEKQPDARRRPVEARLILAYDQGRQITLEPEGIEIGPRLLPPKLLSGSERYSLVVQNLHFGTDQFGFALFQVGPQMGKVYHTLRDNLSKALRGATLLAREQEARAAAEKADQLKTRLLANVTHELRNPLDVILGYTHALDGELKAHDHVSSAKLATEIQHIQHSAEHQRRLIDDLLDLSRAEIGELDLVPELIDTRPFLEQVFRTFSNGANRNKHITWQFQAPARLPQIEADPVRLKQILLNLLSNATKFTERGRIVLGAEISPPHLHFWVQDTGCGIAPELQDQIFAPFVTGGDGVALRRPGIGLGLSITRRLVTLHQGNLAVDSQPGEGSTFHVYLPLPNLGGDCLPVPRESTGQPTLLLVATEDEPVPEIVDLGQRQGLQIRRLLSKDEIDHVLEETTPTVLAWDLHASGASDWFLIQQLRAHPQLRRLPLILYGNGQGQASGTVGLANVMVKPVAGQTLIQFIGDLRPADVDGPVLIVDDEPLTLELYRRVVDTALPDCAIRTATDGAAALELMAETVPCLVILDLMMPGTDGFAVLEWMRSHRQTRQVPVLILTGRALTLEDVERLERHASVVIQSKDMLSKVEMSSSLQRVVSDVDMLPPYTGALVKRTIAYIHQNYHRPLSRLEMAEAVGASKGYLSTIFSREVGLSLWEYLNRYRIVQARSLLSDTVDTVTTIARHVGFKDPAYFSRVFRKVVGISPTAYREQPE